MDTWVVSTFWLLRIILLWTWMYRYLFESLLSVLVGVYPQVELLGNMVILFSIFWGTAMQLPQWLHHVTFPCAAHRIPGLPILANTCYLLIYLFIVVILMGLRWYLIVASISISLMVNDVDSLFMLLAICISSLEKCLFKYITHFKNWVDT